MVVVSIKSPEGDHGGIYNNGGDNRGGGGDGLVVEALEVNVEDSGGSLGPEAKLLDLRRRGTARRGGEQ